MRGRKGEKIHQKTPERETGQSWNEMGAGNGGYCGAENRG